MMKYSGELDLMRRYKTDSKPCPQINKLVFSVFKTQAKQSTKGTTRRVNSHSPFTGSYAYRF
jgi:hypothetical protein